jgi:hypothetical protein
MHALLAVPSFLLVLSGQTGASGKPALTLKLSADNPVVEAGDEIKLRLVVTNESKQALQFDDGVVASYATVRDAGGAEIPPWAFLDVIVIALPPRKESLWSLSPGGHKTIAIAYKFRRDKWAGFGIPGGSYRGHAIEIFQEAGALIHAVPAPPTKVTIVLHWSARAEIVRDRAAKLGVAPGWSGEQASNAVEIRLAAPLR